MSKIEITELNRRTFIQLTAASSAGLIFYNCSAPEISGQKLSPDKILGGLKKEDGKTPLKNATFYSGTSEGDGLLYSFEPGLLADKKCLTADMLLDGKRMAAFRIALKEGDDGPEFRLEFKSLNQCSARIRMPLSAVDQNKWMLEREGAWLKPLVSGDRVDLAKVDRMTFTIFRNGGLPVRWCMTDFAVAAGEVPRLGKLVLPRGKLIDELGQSALHDWAERTKTIGELKTRLQAQAGDAEKSAWPDIFSRWGGWKEKRFNKTGFFSKANDGKRWWLIDPDGYAFWSAGLDCVRVDTAANFIGLEKALSWLPDKNGEFKEIYQRDGSSINYLAANFIRVFGAEKWYKQWSKIALSELRKTGFNTVGNWSDWQIAKTAGVPYVRPLRLNLQETKRIYRDFPDVFHPSYEQEAKEYAKQLEETADDPALVGYFLMNEPTWGFSSETPAAGMLYNTPDCETRKKLAEFLLKKYGDNVALSNAWAIETSFNRVARGPWTQRLSQTALQDMELFSAIMVDRFFKILTDECRRVDPNHMNLGARYHKTPPSWALQGMRYFDVFSMNCYRDRVPADELQATDKALNLPVLIGEFHFGALDVGLPATGIGHVKDQAARGQAYRIYVEDASANPICVGAHWFTLYDQSALGRFDGENYNIGFLDVCNRPYGQMANAARKTHERLYSVASGKEKSFDEAPEYLPKLF